MALKVCTKCGQRKRDVNFYPNVRTKDGLRSECKECTKASTATNRQKRNKRKSLPYKAGLSPETAARLDEIMHIMHEISDKLLAVQELMLSRQADEAEPVDARTAETAANIKATA